MATGLDSGVKITVYWLEKSRAQRIIWLLEELGLSYQIKLFKRDKDMLAAPELKEIHPLGKSPVISVEKAPNPPVILAESATIVEYLVDHFGPHLIPQRYIDGKEGQVGGETESWRRDRYFMHYAEGSLMGLLMRILIVEGIRDAPVPFFIRPVTKMIASQLHSALVKSDLATNLSFLEDQLKSSPGKGLFLCGDILTGSDILMSFPLEAGVLRGLINKEQHPYLTEYVSRIQEREAHKRGIAKIVELQGTYELIP
ncbi:glutathione S-transferase, variant 2 [Blastomyces dermatitidis ATCC 18188]|uniref:glutathione transferase n=1 Tax=Ajellomyces dermatitidis (strain ATCC 18188 / CBS 674.68) TaxID=653446 RepID=F2TSE5_AJEDA|nr:glutathione S-transferase [Blastomyces dermatitidis ATCC 18188]EQL30318.1 glutathione S-transferase [Blastomyces dermatitidis ATCC 26199]EQL30319.1 glutathione S-transferase, variant 1 [Blastomyces dermatitidis ATCC 26199]EQL30320.1 glutathione S-transferase, variant 2 [Blastomyces dermatitidis ATCC 26199]KMW68861.1 glutathione S-transferase, variant 1 [Blastomyces dermatitidis ATCC 18188]